MAWHTDRPIIFPLSSPASLAEATPADLIAWTDGRALIATGGSFTPVTYKGITHVIGQLNNAMLYPGVGLGAIVSRARYISVGMLVAAANALSSLVAVRLAGATLLPHIEDLRSVTVTVAVAVAEAAVQEGLAGVRLADIVQQVEDAMWQPRVSPDRGILTERQAIMKPAALVVLLVGCAALAQVPPPGKSSGAGSVPHFRGCRPGGVAGHRARPRGSHGHGTRAARISKFSKMAVRSRSACSGTKTRPSPSAWSSTTAAACARSWRT